MGIRDGRLRLAVWASIVVHPVLTESVIVLMHSAAPNTEPTTGWLHDTRETGFLTTRSTAAALLEELHRVYDVVMAAGDEIEHLTLLHFLDGAFIVSAFVVDFL